MKRGILFDIQRGASGDMLLGSLLDLGLDAGALRDELQKLDLPGWELRPAQVTKYHMSGTGITLKLAEAKKHRRLDDIEKILTGSALADQSKERALLVFRALAMAEASVHGVPAAEIHFHEIGALDSILDVTAFCIALDLMPIEKIFFNEFPFAPGSVSSSHGDLPAPVPAVLMLARGFRHSVTDLRGELVTPTAAALLTTLGEQISVPASFTLLDCGIGFGTREHPFPSYTRALSMEFDDAPEEIHQLECNLDDLNPQVYPYLIDRLLAAGALDAYITPVSMKKGRPGSLLTVIATKETLEELKGIIFAETTSLGIRTLPMLREKLERRFDAVTIFNHEIGIKTGYYRGKIVNIQPEFEDCRLAAEDEKIPLKEVISRAREKYIEEKRLEIP